MTKFSAFGNANSISGSELIPVADEGVNKTISVNSLQNHILTTPKSGTTANRPTGVPVGYQYYDSTLSKPVWYNSAVWKDASGTTV
jgi:hypothetical protein